MESGDIDSDGDLDLVLAREWNSIALLINQNGELKEKGKAFGLEAFKGLWHDAKLSDLDGNGTLDIIATNIGIRIKHLTNCSHISNKNTLTIVGHSYVI